MVDDKRRNLVAKERREGDGSRASFSLFALDLGQRVTGNEHSSDLGTGILHSGCPEQNRTLTADLFLQT